MRWLGASAVALTLLASSVATAQPDARGIFVVIGYGTKSCGTWTEERQNNRVAADFNEAWVLGYLTAVDEYGQGSGDIAKNIDAAGLKAWVDNYCAASPLKMISDAAHDLGATLTHPVGARTRP